MEGVYYRRILVFFLSSGSNIKLIGDRVTSSQLVVVTTAKIQYSLMLSLITNLDPLCLVSMYISHSHTLLKQTHTNTQALSLRSLETGGDGRAVCPPKNPLQNFFISQTNFFLFCQRTVLRSLDIQLLLTLRSTLLYLVPPFWQERPGRTHKQRQRPGYRGCCSLCSRLLLLL